jgi:nitrogen regulatory protein PII
MHKLIVSIIRHEKIDDVISALKKEQVAFTYSNVKGFCSEVHLYHEDIHERIKIEVIAQEHDVERVKNLIMSNACCGLEGDGCLAVYVLDEYITFNVQ